MIDEIKKEILDYATHDCEILSLHSKRTIKGISTEEIVKILDKYKDIDKYKNAWEEIKQEPYDWENGLTWREYIESLEQKHNIGSEE